ncbi:hypothetical protein ACB092_02G084700 [Castanea dentata]
MGIMDKYLIRKPRIQESSSFSKRICVDFNLENLPSDLGLRENLSYFHPNNHDEIRRYYLQKGPYRKWLEYSKDNDAVFCLYCYLFGQDIGKQEGGETFVMKGFKLWNQKEKLYSYVRGVHSAHNQAIKKIDCIRFLLCQGLAFHSHDESQGSSDKGNFHELLQFLEDHNESINEVLQKAPKDCKLTHHEIQKDIVNAIARKTSKAIIKDLDIGFFSILVDESRDISVKEQMALVLRYVNKKETIIERILGIVHVASTTALSLKYVIECLLCEHTLSLLQLRGQGYDRTSNTQCDINGLKTLILKENNLAFYVHCFAHQLQLTLVAVAKNHINIAEFFLYIVNAINFVKVSKQLLQVTRDDEWISLLTKVSSFCTTYDIPILNMDEIFVLFYTVIDMQLQELNNRFSEVNTDLLLCMACLNPSNSLEKLIHLSKFYQSDFLGTDILALVSQLENYIFDIRNNDLFLELQGVSELTEKLVNTGKHETYSLVYLLMKLVLTIPVTTATVEINQWMNDCLVVYIERDVVCNIDNETIMQRFQNMKTHRRQL